MKLASDPILSFVNHNAENVKILAKIVLFIGSAAAICGRCLCAVKSQDYHDYRNNQKFYPRQFTESKATFRVEHEDQIESVA